MLLFVYIKNLVLIMLDSKMKNVEQVEFPKRTKVLAIICLVSIAIIGCLCIEFIINGQITKESVFNEFNAGGLIAFIFSAIFIFNPFSRKCWI